MKRSRFLRKTILWGLCLLSGSGLLYAQQVPKLPVPVTDTVFFDDFERENASDDWVFEDRNGDGNTWSIEKGGVGVGYSASLKFQGNGNVPDDWAISKAFSLEKGKIYELSYFYNCMYQDEKVEVYLGTERNAQSQIQLLSRQDVTTYGWATVEFQVETDGDYCLGVKVATGPVTMPGLYVDEISVVEQMQGTAPESVSNLVQVPGTNGSLSMGLQWVNPTVDVMGDPLEEITAIEIYKDWGNQPLSYSQSLEPGATVNWTDPDPKPGKVSYHVYVVNASGRSLAQMVNTYVGEDLPSAPRNLEVVNHSGAVTITWDEPGEFGMNGGWYDKTGLSYLVARKGKGYAVLSASTTQKTLIDDVSEMDYYVYEVTAINTKGQGSKAISEGIKVGTSMSLPFNEDFENYESWSNLWTIQDLDGDKATWNLETARGNLQPRCVYWNWLPAVDPYGDYVIPEANDWLFTPMLKLESGKTYRLRYSVAGPMMGDISMRIALGKTANPTAMTTVVEHLKEHATAGAMDFEGRTVEFTAPASGSFCIGFYYYGYEGNGYCWLDDVWVEEVASNDLAVIGMVGTSAPKVGEETVYKVTVENKGTVAARNFKLQLLDDAGSVLAESEEQTRPLSPGRTSEYEIRWTPANINTAALRAMVVWADDQVEGNNVTSVMDVRMQGDGYKAVSVGDGNISSYSTPWYVYNAGFGQMVFPSSVMEGVIGKLKGLSWQLMCGLADTLEDQNLRIWIGETDRADMAAGWFGPDELELVIDSTFAIAPGNYDWYLPFQREYDYKGGNLVVCVEGMNSFGTLGAFGMWFRCTETGWNSISRSSYGTTNVSMSNLDNTKGKFFSLRPNTTFFFNVEGSGSLSGLVKDAQGESLENVRVSIEGYNVVRRTDVGGKYTFPYLPEGGNDITFSLVGYQDVDEHVSVTSGNEVVLDVVMNSLPLVKVSGYVAGTDNPAEGLPLAELALDGPSDYTVITDENGFFSIDEVYGNLEYDVKITASGYRDYEGKLMVGATDTDADTIFIDRMVNMPSVVYAYDKTDYALVKWDEPVPVAWLQLDDGKMYGSFGGNSDMGYIVAHRYLPEDFDAHGVSGNVAVTKVRFFPMAVADFTLQIFIGEEGVESLVYEEEMDVKDYETWYEHDLLNPVPIDPAQCLIVGIKVQQSSGSNPIGFDRGPALPNACLFSENGGLDWSPVSSVSPTMNYNWIIHTLCSADPNIHPTQPDELRGARIPFSKDFLSTYGTPESKFMEEVDRLESVSSAQGEYTFEILPRAERKRIPSKEISSVRASVPYQYEVFRLLNGQEKMTELWTEITEEPVSERSVEDKDWQPLYDTMYRYAVRSVLDGVRSDFTFSRAVDKGKYSSVRLKVETNTGVSSEGAVLTIEGINNTYVDTVDASGIATISDIHFGTYKMSVSKEGFNTYKRSDIVLSQHDEDLGTVELIEDVRPPRNFQALDYLDYVDLSWDKPIRTQEVTLSKTTGEYSTGAGMNYGGTMEVGQRFTPAELQAAGVDGFYLESISFWPDASADFTLKVWKSDYEGQEKEFYTQQVTSDQITLGEWNTIELDEPVFINAKQYYIFGYSAYMSSQAYPCGYDMGPVTEGGDAMFYEGEWISFCSMAPTMYDFNWLIRANVSNLHSSKSLVKAEDDFDYTYEVLRFAQADSATVTSWTKISTEDYKEFSLRDEDWKDLPDGNYYYAVFSRSQAGNTSDTVLSAMLPKGQVSLVSVSASTNNGTSAEGALVSLVSEDSTHVYNGTLGSDEKTDIPAVLKGDYVLRIQKEGFQDYIKEVSVDQSRTQLSGNVLQESLLSPLAVRALMQESEQVRVDWYSPMSTGIYPHYITWSKGEFYTGIGQGANAFNFSAAHKYTTFDLEEKRAVGGYIHKIRFYVASTDQYPTQATFRVAIWEGEDGQQVYSQTVPANLISMNNWVEVTLTTPYHIDGTKTIMVGYICQATQGWVGGIDYGPAVRGKGNMINVDGTWMTVTALSPDLDYNWMIEAYVTDDVEVGNNSKNSDSKDFVQSYSLYRLRESDKDDFSRWTSLAANTAETTFTDNLSGMEDDYYVYAVKAIYSSGESPYTFSSAIGKGVGNETLEPAVVKTLSVLPNPNRGRFSVELPFEGTLYIYTIDGKQVYSCHKLSGFQNMDVDLPSGRYVVILDSGVEQAYGNLIIAK